MLRIYICLSALCTEVGTLCYACTNIHLEAEMNYIHKMELL